MDRKKKMTKSQAITPPSAARIESPEETPHKRSICPWRWVFFSQYISATGHPSWTSQTRFHLNKLFLTGLRLLLFDGVLIIKHGIHLFRSTGGFTQMPGWDLNVKVGGCISYPSLKGGKKIRDQGNVNAPTPHLRAERNLHSGCYLHPHTPSFWEKQSAHLPSQIMWNPTKGLVKKHAHAVGGPPLDAIWILHNTWPRGRRRRAGLQGSEQILQREVKLDGRRCIRAKRGTHSWFHKGVWNRNSVRLSPAASGSLRARQRCLLNLPEERCCTVTNPGTSGCSRDQYHKQEFHLRTNNPHTPSDLNNFFGLADCRDKTKYFAHPCVDAVRNMWGYWWERALLHVSLVTKTSFHQSAKIQISVWILNQGSWRTADWYFRL